MIQTLFYINNSIVNPPLNWQELLVELNYGKDEFPNKGTISISDFQWVRENYDWIETYIAGGLTGGAGIFESPPLRIEITNGTTTKVVFNGFIDLSEGLNVKEGIKFTAKAMSHATVDWLNEVASGFTFEYLASLPSGTPGAIGSSNYRWVPYVNNKVPNYEQAAIATLMVYTIQQAIAKEIEEITGLVSEAGGYFTTIPAVIKLIVKIAYLIILILTLIKLIQDLIKFIISPVKYHACMYVRDLMAKGCEYLGMTFSSEIWELGSDYSNEVIMPEKQYNAPSNTDSSILGFLIPESNDQNGFYKGTFAQLIEGLKIKYNAKIVVTANNEVIFIRKDKNAQPAVYQLPDIYVPEFSYNTDELQANTLIEFQTDNTETNTLQNYSGSIYQVICQPVVVNYRPFVMMKNFNQVSIPFARAFAKTGLTVPEKIIDDFLEVFDAIANVIVVIVNAVISVVNAIIKVIKKIFKLFGINLSIPAIPLMNQLSLGTLMDNRIGMMLLSDDHFSVPKIFILTEGSQSKFNKIATNNSTLESAKLMWNRFHYVNSFIPAQLNSAYLDRPTGNQYVRKTFPAIAFTWQNFLDVFTNNRIFDAQGNEAVVESLKFNPFKSTAQMTVRFGKIYTLNLKETYLNPTGN